MTRQSLAQIKTLAKTISLLLACGLYSIYPAHSNPQSDKDAVPGSGHSDTLLSLIWATDATDIDLSIARLNRAWRAELRDSENQLSVARVAVDTEGQEQDPAVVTLFTRRILL